MVEPCQAAPRSRTPGSLRTPSQTPTPPSAPPPPPTCGRTSSLTRGRRTLSALERATPRSTRGEQQMCPTQNSVRISGLCPFCHFTGVHLPLEIGHCIFVNIKPLKMIFVHKSNCLSPCHLSRPLLLLLYCPHQRPDQPTELSNPPRPPALLAANLPEKNQSKHRHPCSA